MFNGIGWLQYIRTIALVVLAYYIIIGWMYRKELLQWWRARKKP